MAQLASVAGQVFRHKELQRAVFRALEDTDMDENRFNESFRSLLETQFIRAKPLAGRAVYEFCCRKIWGMFYRSMSRTDRKEQHAAFAQMLEQEFPEVAQTSPEELAWHYARASDLDMDPAHSLYTEKAAHWWRRAGQVATDRLALKEAISAFARARRYVRKAPREETNKNNELYIELDLITALELQHGPGARRVAVACERARELARNGNELSLVFHTQWKDWLFTYVRGDFRKALEMAGDLQRSSLHEESAIQQLEAYHAMWDTLFHVGDLHKAIRFHHLGTTLSPDMSVEQSRRGYAGHAGDVCNHVRSALVFWLLGDPVGSRRLCEKGMALAGALNHEQSTVHAHCYRAILGILARTPAEITAHAMSALDIATDRLLKPLMAFAKILMHIGELQKEPTKSVLESLETSLEERTHLGIRLFETLFLASLAEGYLKTGDCENGMRVIADALKVSEDTGELVFRSELHRIRGELLADSTKNRQEAKAEFQQAAEWADHTGARLLKVRSLASLNRFLRSYGAGKKERLAAEEELRTALQKLSRSVECQDLDEAARIVEEV